MRGTERCGSARGTPGFEGYPGVVGSPGKKPTTPVSHPSAMWIESEVRTEILHTSSLNTARISCRSVRVRLVAILLGDLAILIQV